jgi:hypothetical protein
MDASSEVPIHILKIYRTVQAVAHGGEVGAQDVPHDTRITTRVSIADCRCRLANIVAEALGVAEKRYEGFPARPGIRGMGVLGQFVKDGRLPGLQGGCDPVLLTWLTTVAECVQQHRFALTETEAM